jgi:hypothetical protein
LELIWFGIDRYLESDVLNLTKKSVIEFVTNYGVGDISTWKNKVTEAQFRFTQQLNTTRLTLADYVLTIEDILPKFPIM